MIGRFEGGLAQQDVDPQQSAANTKHHHVFHLLSLSQLTANPGKSQRRKEHLKYSYFIILQGKETARPFGRAVF